MYISTFTALFITSTLPFCSVICIKLFALRLVANLSSLAFIYSLSLIGFMSDTTSLPTTHLCSSDPDIPLPSFPIPAKNPSPSALQSFVERP